MTSHVADTSASSTQSNSSGTSIGQPPRRWLILAVVCLAQLMVVLDATVVNIALPSAQKQLAFSNADRSWIVTAYSLAFGGLLLLGGRLSDKYGRHRVLIVGMVGFAAASAMAGIAPSFGVLVAGRAIQGGFGALLAPAALSTLTTTFTNPSERGKAFGLFGAISGAGGAVGLLLGGLLTEYADWRWTLFVNVAFAAIAVTIAVRVLGFSRQSNDSVRLDPAGTSLVVAGLAALVYGLTEAQNSGWESPLSLGPIIGGIALIAAFGIVERRTTHPLLPLRVVLDRTRGGAYLAIGLSATGMFGIFLFLTYFLQQIKGYSPLLTGVAFLPMIITLILVSTTASALLMPRLGPRPMIPIGAVIAAAGLLLFAIGLSPTASYPGAVLGPLLLVGAGLGVVFSAAQNSATFGTNSDDAGVASAMVNTSQQVGGAIGTALLNTIATSVVRSFIATHRGSAAAKVAAVHGYTAAFWVSAGIFVAVAVVSALVFRSGRLGANGPRSTDQVAVGVSRDRAHSAS